MTSRFRHSSVSDQLAASLCMLLAMPCLIASAELSEVAEMPEEPMLPLPRWSEQELKMFRSGLPSSDTPGVLLPENGGSPTDIKELLNAPISNGPRLDHYFPPPEVELSPRLKSEDMRLFLPESILGLPTHAPANGIQLPTPQSSLKDVSPEFLTASSRFLPKDYLIDPDLLMPEMQSHDMTRLLEFHAKDARIKLHVLVIPHDRKLPSNVRLDQIASGGLLQTDACLLVYPLAEPWRARLFVSRSVHSQTSAEFLSETLQSCLSEALQTSDVHDQLHRYAIHLSTRLFWLQRALGKDPTAKSDQDLHLAEVNPDPTAHEPQQASHAAVIWTFAVLLLLGVCGFITHLLRNQLRLKRQNRVWMLPEPENTVPRLGGAFTGGGGGMIRYA